MKYLNFKIIFILFFGFIIEIQSISWGDITSRAGSVFNRGVEIARQGAQTAKEAGNQGIDVVRRGAESVKEGAQSAARTVGEGAQTAGRAIGSAAVDFGRTVQRGGEAVYNKSEQIYDAVKSIVNGIKDSISNIKDTISKAANIKTDVIDNFSSLPNQATEVTKKPIDTMIETAKKLPEDYNRSANLVNQKDLSGISQMLKTTQNMLTTILDSTDELFTNVLDKVKWQKPIVGLSNIILSLNQSFIILITLVKDITVKLVGKVFGQESSVVDAESVLNDILSVTNDISKISENITKIMKSSENKS